VEDSIELVETSTTKGNT